MSKKGTAEKLNRNGNKRGMSPNSQKNLGRGRIGNNHAKKDYSITRIIKRMLDQPAEERWLELEDKHQGFTWRQAIAKRILIESVKGNAKVTIELLDRLEGKVTQPISGEGGKPIEVNIDYRDKILNAVSRYATRSGEEQSSKGS